MDLYWGYVSVVLLIFAVFL